MEKLLVDGTNPEVEKKMAELLGGFYWNEMHAAVILSENESVWREIPCKACKGKKEIKLRREKERFSYPECTSYPSGRFEYVMAKCDKCSGTGVEMERVSE